MINICCDFEVIECVCLDSVYGILYYIYVLVNFC